MIGFKNFLPLAINVSDFDNNMKRKIIKYFYKNEARWIDNKNPELDSNYSEVGCFYVDQDLNIMFTSNPFNSYSDRNRGYNLITLNQLFISERIKQFLKDIKN